MGRIFLPVLLPFLLVAAGAEAANVNLSTARFSWTAPTVDAVHGAPTTYTLKCGTATGGPYPTTFGVVATPSPSTLVKNVVPTAGTYFCVVTASNAGGESGGSNEVNFTSGFPPSPPTGLGVQ